MTTQEQAKAIQLILDPPGMYENPPRGWNAEERALLNSMASAYGISLDQYKKAVLSREITASTPMTAAPKTTTPTTATTPTTTAPQGTVGGPLLPSYYGVRTPTSTGTTPSTGTSDVSQQDYQDYLNWQKDNPWMPKPKNYEDYVANWQTWLDNISYYLSEGKRQYDTWLRYAQQSGGLDDWYPTSIEDWYANYDKAQQQLALWKQQATTAEQEKIEGDEYALSPEEAARRREEAYAESRYAAKERYYEQPRYQEKFASWVKEQGDMSGALEQYITNKYPSLRAQFEAQLSPLTGFETREQARAVAAQRETGWQSWLTERQPDTEQEYWSQRPQDRGERMYMYQPTLRAVNW